MFIVYQTAICCADYLHTKILFAISINLLTSNFDHKYEQKHPNSTNMNNSAELSNLEYVFFNLFIKLFYNDLILANLLLSFSCKIMSHVVQYYLVTLQSCFLFISKWNGIKGVKFLNIFANCIILILYNLQHNFTKWKIIPC